MTNIGITILVVLGVAMVGRHGDVKAQMLRQMTPQAAEDYASDSEKAARGDPEAAYRLGKYLESGRLGGFIDLNKALKFYKLAAEEGHQQAAARVAQIEDELSRSQKEEQTPPTSLGN